MPSKRAALPFLRTLCCVAGCGALQIWLEDCRRAFSLLTTEKQREASARNAREEARAAVQPDDLIDFQVLKNRKGLSQLEVEDEVTSGRWRGHRWCMGRRCEQTC